MKGIIETSLNVLKNKLHYVTSDYKTRNTARPTHAGIDLVSYNGKNTTTDEIVSVYDGKVIGVGYQATSSGYYVKIKHQTCESLYCHLKKGSIKVKKGDKVTTGEVIGTMGSTGNSTGSHLHFEIRVNNKSVDPYPYLINENLFNLNFSIGKYKLKYEKTIRTSTSLVASNRVKVKQCMSSIKPLLTSNKPNDIAKFKVGSIVDITQVIYKNGRLWGKLKNSYIVLCNIDGTLQAEKITE